MLVILTLVMYSMQVKKWHLANSLGIIVFYLGKISYVCLKCSLHDLLVRQAHEGSLIGYFGISKTKCVTYKVLYET